MRSAVPLFLLFFPSILLPSQPAPATFLEPPSFGSGEDQALAVADFNLDGIPDVAAVGGSLDIYLGDGHGGFQVMPEIGLNGTAIVTGDFNADGAPDIAITSTSGLLVLFGNGDGTFRPPIVFGGDFLVLTTGDFNGDGRLDIAVGSSTAQVQVFLATRGGSFQPGPVTLIPSGNPSALASADFNHDGLADLAVGVSNSATGLSVLLSTGAGDFSTLQFHSAPNAPALSALVAVDVNGDGSPDLVYLASNDTEGEVKVLLNNGQGVFRSGKAAFLESCNAGLATADLNGDGIPDLVVGCDALIAVLFGQSAGTFSKPVYYVLGNSGPVAIADFNNDGIQDVAGVGFGISLLLGTGGGAFDSSRAFALSSNPTGLVAADVNRDGNLDLIVSNNRAVSPTISVFYGAGDGTFGNPDQYPANEPGPLAIGDFNRDGIHDIAFAGHNSVGVLPGNGDGSFGYAVYSPCASCQGTLLAGDFNGDGVPDLLTFQLIEDEMVVVTLKGNGDGTFGSPVAVMLPGVLNQSASASAAFLADFRNNGILDIVIGADLGDAYIALGNGDGTFAVPTLLTTYGYLGVPGDFNRDGNTDIALSGTVYLGHGDATFTPVYSLDAFTVPVIAADFNGDGITDLLCVPTGSYAGTANLQLGLGNGNFVQQAQTFAVSQYDIAGDFNNDGRRDIATYGYASPVWVLLNTTTP